MASHDVTEEEIARMVRLLRVWMYPKHADLIESLRAQLAEAKAEVETTEAAYDRDTDALANALAEARAERDAALQTAEWSSTSAAFHVKRAEAAEAEVTRLREALRGTRADLLLTAARMGFAGLPNESDAVQKIEASLSAALAAAPLPVTGEGA